MLICICMRLSTLSTVTFVLLTFRCEAAIHYCENGGIRRVDVSYEAGQEEKLQPMVDTASVPAAGAISCKWEAAAVKLDDDALVVVTGFNASQQSTRRRVMRSIEADASSSKMYMYYQLLGPKATCSSRVAEAPEPVASDTMRVFQLLKGSHLSVTYESQASVAVSKLPPGLVVQLVEAGFCSRKMASFQRSCYQVTPRQLSLRDQLTRLRADSRVLQLASFHSLEMIRQFVEVNKQKAVFFAGGMRSKVPLSLSAPVRIGLFYSRADKSIKFINSAGGHGCLLQDVTDPQNFTAIATETVSTHSCGSLRVDQRTGREVVEFGDCGQQLPALVSFADSPRSACGDCSQPVVDWLSSSTGSGDVTTQAEDFVAARRSWVLLAILAIAGCYVFGATVALVIFLLRLRRARMSPRRGATLPLDTYMKSTPRSESLLTCELCDQSGGKAKQSMSNGLLGHTKLVVEPTELEPEASCDQLKNLKIQF